MFNAIVMTVCYATTHVLNRLKSQAMRINIVFKKRELQFVNLRLLRYTCDTLVSNYAHSSVLSLFGWFRPVVHADKSKLMLSSSVRFSKIRVYLHEDNRIHFMLKWPCIVIIFVYIINKMHQVSKMLLCYEILHVSCIHLAHHQELSALHAEIGVFHAGYVAAA